MKFRQLVVDALAFQRGAKAGKIDGSKVPEVCEIVKGIVNSGAPYS